MKVRYLVALALWLSTPLAVAQADSWQLSQTIGGFNKAQIYAPASDY
ncbi:MAG: hypothetical protein JJU31_14730 [Wenzhouxiangella sp.]|nr:hypothetical protein [Wenzhouxiangella sp.]MCH8479261.1 hypothetical protein [Wenzhouxiangella sp.]